MKNLIERIIHDLNLPAFVRAYFALQGLTALEMGALRDAGLMPVMYCRWRGKPVRILRVNSVGEVAVGGRDDPFATYEYADFEDLTDFSQKWVTDAPWVDPKSLVTGLPVKRDDGRYYIPVNRADIIKDYSLTVARVASDAFPSLNAAQDFATLLVRNFNSEKM